MFSLAMTPDPRAHEPLVALLLQGASRWRWTDDTGRIVSPQAVRIENPADGPLAFVAYVSGRSARVEAGRPAPAEIPGGDALLAALAQAIPRLPPFRLLYACRAVGVTLSEEGVPTLWRRGIGLPSDVAFEGLPMKHILLPALPTLAAHIPEDTAVPVAGPMAASLLSFRCRAAAEAFRKHAGPAVLVALKQAADAQGPQVSLFLHRARSVAVLTSDKPDLLAVFPDR
jgi:hypothetical protein